MKVKYVLAVLFMMLNFVVRVKAWDCPEPAPEGCWVCEAGVWAPYGNCYGSYETGYYCASSCDHCVACFCESKPSTQCYTDSECSTGYRCENCICVPKTCWVYEYHDTSSTGSCASCSGIDVCQENIPQVIYVSKGYYAWRAALLGESGFSRNPTKVDATTIMFIMGCDEDWDASAVGAWATAMGLSCYLGSAAGVAGCAAGLIVAGAPCVHDGPCTLVDNCVPEVIISRIALNVVDWSADWGTVCRGE